MTPLNTGDKAPNFSVEDQDGHLHELKDYKGSKLIVFFYPKANTPGCTAEACNLKDHWSSFQEQGFKILGVSADTKRRQSNFKNKYDLPFPLIADEEKTMINAFGVWGPKKFMGKEYEGIHRTTFVIDENGIIIDIVKKVKTKAHADQLLTE